MTLNPRYKIPFATFVSLIIAFLVVLTSMTANAYNSGVLTNRSVTISSSQTDVTARYSFSFKPTSLNTIQNISFQFCSNDPFPGEPCTAPIGFDASNASMVSESGDLGFTKSAESTSNRLVLSRAPFTSLGQQNTYVFDNIKNPTNRGSFYVRLQTYQDGDISGLGNSAAGIVFAINDSIDVTAVVPPYLLFCTGVTVTGFDCENVDGNFVNFGEFGSRQASQGSTQMLAATNAKDGYAIRVAGTTLMSGNNIIPSLVGADVSRPGVSQFGMNLRANNSPRGGSDVIGAGNGLPTNGYNQINFYRFNSGDVVAVSNGPDNARKYTATYVVNVAKGQSPGIYVSTVTYIALGSF